MLVTLDFETYYDTKLNLRSMTTMEYVKHDLFKVWGVGIKINDEPTEWYGEDEAEVAICDIDWTTVTLVCHNTPFDGYILTQYYKCRPKYYVDTAAMSRALSPGQSASLKDTAIRMFPTDESMRKGEELITVKGIYDLNAEQDETLGGYCIQDVDLTYAIYNKARPSFPDSEMDIIDLTTRMFCEPSLKIDRERLTKYHEQEYNNAEQLIKDSNHDRKVLSSNQKFADLLESMGLTVPLKTSITTGKKIPAFGKNDAAWKQLCKMYPEHDHIWKARTAVKSRLTETRAKRFLDAADENDFIPVPIRYYAAHTGRFGGTDKLNMQNLPRDSELRKCLIAPEGNLIYVADLSNIEARMLAWLAGQDDLVQQFRNGEDIYSNFASKIYSKPIDKNRNPTERFVGKTAILGLGYGMGHNKFQATLESGAMGPSMKFTTDQAFEVVSTYRNSYPRIPALWKRLENLLLDSLNNNKEPITYGPLTVGQRSLMLPNGLALKYKGLYVNNNRQLEYFVRGKPETTYGGRITENVVQALSRIVITDSIIRLSKSIPNGHVALTVHDEVVIVAPDQDPHATMDKIIKDMCTPPEWAADLPLDAEGGYSDRYSK